MAGQAQEKNACITHFLFYFICPHPRHKNICIQAPSSSMRCVLSLAYRRMSLVSSRTRMCTTQAPKRVDIFGTELYLQWVYVQIDKFMGNSITEVTCAHAGERTMNADGAQELYDKWATTYDESLKRFYASMHRCMHHRRSKTTLFCCLFCQNFLPQRPVGNTRCQDALQKHFCSMVWKKGIQHESSIWAAARVTLTLTLTIIVTIILILTLTLTVILILTLALTLTLNSNPNLNPEP